MPLKVFLFLALAAILFSRMEQIVILNKGNKINVSVKLF